MVETDSRDEDSDPMASGTPAYTTYDDLDAFLLSDRTPPGTMGVDVLDGYLTALAVCPEELDPQEWMPHVFGDEGEFASAEAEEEAVWQVNFLYQETAITLAREPEAYEPVLIHGDDGPVVEPWMAGFMLGMSFNRSHWRRLMESDGLTHLVPIAAFMRNEAGDGYIISEDGDPEIGDLRRRAHDMLPDAVRGMYAFFRPGGGVRGGSKVGRNEPCPCGSGRKHKKCCGARV